VKNISVNPSANCAFLINRFLFLKAPEKLDQIEEKFIPDGHMSFVFNFEGRVTVSDSVKTYVLPPNFIVIPAIKFLTICTFPPLDTMVVVCKSTVLTRLFGVDLSNPSDMPFIDAKTIIPSTIWEALKINNNELRRKEIFEEFVIKNSSEAYVPDEIDQIYTKIILSKGETHVEELLKQSDMNPRSFRRHFTSRAGLNAKALSRLVRVNYLWDSYLKGDKADFQNMVYIGNYCDQAHLIHDLKKIIGETPSHFFKKDQKRAMFISGKILD
jgi:AraC-like DNA-binding protein